MFRTIAIIGLLLVITYIGIKIVLSSIASEKSKYKEMLKDWFVALCLVFFMHYIMSGAITICAEISKKLDIPDNDITEIRIGLNNGTYIYQDENLVKYDPLMTDIRLNTQFGDAGHQVSYTIMYTVLVIYTAIFSVLYLKRVLYVAFFTIIAPFVALTYPIDKFKDKKAQGFEFWIKGYLFNMIIQPIHLILYFVVVGTSMELALENPIYGLVAIGFLLPAEKLIRKFFGFDKMDTSKFASGMISGAFLMTGINKLKGMGKSKKGSGKKGQDVEKKKTQIRTTDSGNNTGSIMNDIANENSKDNQDIRENGNIDDDNKEEKDIDEAVHETHRKMNLDDNQNQDLTNEKKIENKDNKKISTQNNNSEDNKNAKDNSDDNNDEEKSKNKDAIRKINVKDEDKITKEKEDKELKKKKRKVRALKAKHFLKSGLKFTGKGLIKAYGAATLGTIGVAAGLASEKYSNVATYGIGGAVAGRMVAKSAINRVGRLPSDIYRIKNNIDTTVAEAEKEVYTDKERKKIQNEKLDEKFMKDRKIKEKYSKAFEVDDPKSIMEEAKKYRKYGIVDDDLIIKAMKLDDENFKSMSDKRRILAAKVSSQIKRNDMENFRNRLIKNGISQRDVDLIEQSVIKLNDWE